VATWLKDEKVGSR